MPLEFKWLEAQVSDHNFEMKEELNTFRNMVTDYENETSSKAIMDKVGRWEILPFVRQWMAANELSFKLDELQYVHIVHQDPNLDKEIDEWCEEHL